MIPDDVREACGACHCKSNEQHWSTPTCPGHVIQSMCRCAAILMLLEKRAAERDAAWLVKLDEARQQRDVEWNDALGLRLASDSPDELRGKLVSFVVDVRDEARKQERERCATVADKYKYRWQQVDNTVGQDYIEGDPAFDIAAAIREGK